MWKVFLPSFTFNDNNKKSWKSHYDFYDVTFFSYRRRRRHRCQCTVSIQSLNEMRLDFEMYLDKSPRTVGHWWKCVCFGVNVFGCCLPEFSLSRKCSLSHIFNLCHWLGGSLRFPDNSMDSGLNRTKNMEIAKLICDCSNVTSHAVCVCRFVSQICDSLMLCNVCLR